MAQVSQTWPISLTLFTMHLRDLPTLSICKATQLRCQACEFNLFEGAWLLFFMLTVRNEHIYNLEVSTVALLRANRIFFIGYEKFGISNMCLCTVLSAFIPLFRCSSYPGFHLHRRPEGVRVYTQTRLRIYHLHWQQTPCCCAPASFLVIRIFTED